MYFPIRYKHFSIAFIAWESTAYPETFVEAVKKNYDQLWVPSTWQKGYSGSVFGKNFVKVVPEGVDPDIYTWVERYPIDKKPKGTVDFLIVGKWEPRKSTEELIRAFIKGARDYYRLHLVVDNPFPVDHLKTTQERLDFYKLNDPRIIIHSDLNDQDLVDLYHRCDIFLSCSRAEGWNLPLIEAMACGCYCVYSDTGAQKAFARGYAVPIQKQIAPFDVFGLENCPGYWEEPSYQHLQDWIEQLNIIELYSLMEKTKKTSKWVRSAFSWDAAAEKATQILQEINPIKEIKAKYDNLTVSYHFINVS